MQIDIHVGEPDIGGIKPERQVKFTVLAYPNTTFTGRVTQVRMNPQTLNNVVTYASIRSKRSASNEDITMAAQATENGKNSRSRVLEIFLPAV
ncbi:MAG TPA: hypothetical protein VNF68_05155 [Candidatus Baltobacteraceae bacterium]|nr:hypothetical protein [Candidatus Baltobacteraceae bacterium]